MRNKYLLGVNGNQIVIGEVEIYNDGQFAASFDVGEAFPIKEFDQEEYYNNLWDELDAASKIQATRDCSITKEDWIEECCDEEDYRDCKDCSCTDLEIDINYETYNFESICCGQHDFREDYGYNTMAFTNKSAVMDLLKLWDNYHLKTLDEEGTKTLASIQKKLSAYHWSSGAKVEEFIQEKLEVE